MVKRIFIGMDSSCNYERNRILQFLSSDIMLSNYSFEEVSGDNYIEVADEVCSKVRINGSYGILICESGSGSAMVANKKVGIRAAVCNDSCSASLVKSHNDANVICLGAKIIGMDVLKAAISTFILTPFDKKYLENVNKIKVIENTEIESWGRK